MKRVIIIHGWGGNPQDAWIPWLSKELKAKGFDVLVPEMPDTDHPKIEPWVQVLADLHPDEETILVGHSIGSQVILRYAESLQEGKIIAGAVHVAGWLTLKNLEEGEEPIAKPWLEIPIDAEKVRAHIRRQIAIFSDDDFVVPIENADFFKEKFGAVVIIEHAKGHFTGETDVFKLPSALEAVMKLAE